MSRMIDMTGMVCGLLTVLRREPCEGRIQWRCSCKCGNEHVARGEDLRSGKITSCGCIRRHNASLLNLSHGDSRVGAVTHEYETWLAMVRRCNDPNVAGYHNYGGRGITVAPCWLGDTGFQNFLSHVGRKPSPQHTLDRIDNSKGYEPGNVRWATRTQQARNTRRNRFLTHVGRTQTVKEWAIELGVHPDALYSRLRLGWSDEEALTTPVRRSHR